jgi:hypothetical protein
MYILSEIEYDYYEFVTPIAVSDTLPPLLRKVEELQQENMEKEQVLLVLPDTNQRNHAMMGEIAHYRIETIEFLEEK